MSTRMGSLLAGSAVAAYLLFLPLATKPDLSTFLLLSLGLMGAIGCKGLRLRLARIDVVVIVALVASTAVSSLLSSDPARSGRFLVFACFNVGILILAASIVSRQGVRLLFGCLAAVGVVHLFALLWAVQSGGDLSANSVVRQAHMATLIAPNDAMILGLCLPFLVYFSPARSDGLMKLSRLPIFVYLALACYISFRLHSKVAFLSLVIAASLTFAAARRPQRWTNWRGKRRLAALVAGAGTVAALIVVAWYLGNQSTTRLSLWEQALTAYDSPVELVLGAGPNTFLYDPGLAQSDFDRGDLVITWVHNLYLEAFHDQGLFGLLVMIALSVIPVVRALRIEDPGIRVVVLATMMTFIVMAFLEITLTRRFYFALLMGMYGLTAAHKNRGTSS